MDSYSALLLPPSLFGGLELFCPCLKPGRSGPEYDKRLRRMRCQLVNNVYATEVALFFLQADASNKESLYYAEYESKMTAIATVLEQVLTRGDQNVRETARVELIKAAEDTESFLRVFFEKEELDFKAEAARRVANTIAALASRGVPRKTLLTAQAGLQEVMNSCAGFSEKRARKRINALDELTNNWDAAKSTVSAYYDLVGKGSLELLDLVNAYQNEMEVFESDLDDKVQEATGRWQQIRSQSKYRAVVSTDEDVPNTPPRPNQSGIGINDLNPAEAFKNTGMSMEKLGKGIVNAPFKAVTLASSGLSGAVGVVDRAAERAVTGASKLASDGASKVRLVGSQVSTGLSKTIQGSNGAKQFSPPKPPAKPIMPKASRPGGYFGIDQSGF